MTAVRLIDCSMRDGNQSIWGATGLNTPQILQIAPVVNRVGFHAIDFSASTHMGVAVRYHREDPWERIRLARAAMPNTTLQFIGTGLRFISWESQDADFMRLVYRCLVEAGILRYVVLDPMLDKVNMLDTAAIMREVGATEIIAALTYTISAAHDDAFYADLAATMAASPNFDRLYIKDPAGLLTPERARSLIPALRAVVGQMPLELHSHCTIGLAPLTYTVAAELGIDVLHVAVGPLANGSSLPSALRSVANLRDLGHTVEIDDRALAMMTDYFDRLAIAEGLSIARPREYDASFLRHQVAGGVMSTTKRQLDELGMGHLFEAVMEEVDRVRSELGYPIMVTPFPQIVCTQAMYNVVGSERYATVPDQVIRYVLGRFGRPIAPLNPDIMDRILASPRARELMAEDEVISLTALRKRFPPTISDEEFLLRATMPADQVDAMLAAGPARRRYNPDSQPLLKLLREVVKRPRLGRIVIDRPDFRLDIGARSSPPAAS